MKCQPPSGGAKAAGLKAARLCGRGGCRVAYGDSNLGGLSNHPMHRSAAGEFLVIAAMRHAAPGDGGPLDARRECALILSMA